jgi:hypothetical protein
MPNIINIYELAHKCKVWALDNGYSVSTRLQEMTVFGNEILRCAEASVDIKECGEHRYSNHGEPEVVFRVCQWILENIVGEKHG